MISQFFDTFFLLEVQLFGAILAVFKKKFENKWHTNKYISANLLDPVRKRESYGIYFLHCALLKVYDLQQIVKCDKVT